MFKDQLIEALQEGILIFVKWGFIAAVVLFSWSYFNELRQMALNGQNSALAIKEFQTKGWLPQFTNGVVPEKK